MKEGNPPTQIQQAIAPLSEQDAKRGPRALEEAERLAAEMLARRQGQPLPSSWEDLRHARQEREQRL